MSNPTEKMTGLRKAAVMMVLLGDQAASGIYRLLPKEQVERLTREIARLDAISKKTAAEILEESRTKLQSEQYLPGAGPDYAEKLLLAAFGEAAGKSIFAKATADSADEGDLAFLEKTDPQELATFLSGEHPQTIALVAAHLGPKSGATLLKTLSEDTRTAVIERLARMQQFSPQVFQTISTVLKQKLLSLEKQDRRQHSGTASAAALLNRMDSKSREALLQKIQGQDEELASSIRDAMFTFEDLKGAPDASIRELLTQVEKKSLALALKGASEELQERVYRNMSSRAVEMLKEDMDVLGSGQSQQIAQARRDIVTVARNLEAAGKLVLREGNDDENL